MRVHQYFILDFRFWILDLRSRQEKRFFTEMLSLCGEFKVKRKISSAKPTQNPKSKVQNRFVFAAALRGMTFLIKL
jgi:hypothetical protein